MLCTGSLSLSIRLRVRLQTVHLKALFGILFLSLTKKEAPFFRDSCRKPGIQVGREYLDWCPPKDDGEYDDHDEPEPAEIGVYGFPQRDCVAIRKPMHRERIQESDGPLREDEIANDVRVERKLRKEYRPEWHSPAVDGSQYGNQQREEDVVSPHMVLVQR